MAADSLTSAGPGIQALGVRRPLDSTRAAAKADEQVKDVSHNDRIPRRGRIAGRLVALSALLIVALEPGLAAAQRPDKPLDPLVRFQTVQQRGISLRQAIALAQQRYQGRVVRAETKEMNGRRVHEIRILGDDGRVRTLHFDADAGGNR